MNALVDKDTTTGNSRIIAPGPLELASPAARLAIYTSHPNDPPQSSRIDDGFCLQDGWMVTVVETEHQLKSRVCFFSCDDSLNVRQITARRLLTEDVATVFKCVYAHIR